MGKWIWKLCNRHSVQYWENLIFFTLSVVWKREIIEKSFIPEKHFSLSLFTVHFHFFSFLFVKISLKFCSSQFCYYILRACSNSTALSVLLSLYLIIIGQATWNSGLLLSRREPGTITAAEGIVKLLPLSRSKYFSRTLS